MTDEALTVVRNGQETKQKFSKPGLESSMQFFNDYHVEIKRTITLASVRRPKRTTKKGKTKHLYLKIHEIKGKFKPR